MGLTKVFATGRVRGGYTAAVGDLDNPYNPYAPPTQDEVFQAPVDEVYKSSEGISVALRVMLGANVALLMISVSVLSMQVELLQRATRSPISMAEAEANDQRVLLATSLALLVLIATGILWCVWQNRTNKNLRALGAVDLQFGPNAWGWFFCPVVNLWRPVAVISELWTAASDASSQDEEPVPPNWLIGGWWLPWLLGGILSQIAARTATDVNDIGSLVTSSQVELVSDVMTLISGVFAIVLVTKLQKRVRARAAGRLGRAQMKGLL